MASIVMVDPVQAINEASALEWLGKCMEKNVERREDWKKGRRVKIRGTVGDG